LHPKGSSPALSLDRIQDAVSSFYGITGAELVSSTRTARVAWPRQLALYLARELTDEPLATIGRAFGGRNHATVLHACKRVSERLLQDDQTERDVEELASALRRSGGDRSY
jgi:chromosomal replication initiator protein